MSCPSCGYCPSCGRSGSLPQTNPFQPVPFMPDYPSIPNVRPFTTTYGALFNGRIINNENPNIGTVTTNNNG